MVVVVDGNEIGRKHQPIGPSAHRPGVSRVETTQQNITPPDDVTTLLQDGNSWLMTADSLSLIPIDTPLMQGINVAACRANARCSC
jgi:hypothetical protein